MLLETGNRGLDKISKSYDGCGCHHAFRKIAANGGGGGFDLETRNLQLFCGGEEKRRRNGFY